MEPWGTGSFENDAAAAFVKEVLEDGPAAIEEALEVVLDPDLSELEAEEGARAVAAAEIVQAQLNGDTASLTDAGLRAWLAEQGENDFDDLRELALEALDRVQGPGSELPELWADSEDHAEWQADIQRLRAGLGG